MLELTVWMHDTLNPNEDSADRWVKLGVPIKYRLGEMRELEPYGLRIRLAMPELQGATEGLGDLDTEVRRLDMELSRLYLLRRGKVIEESGEPNEDGWVCRAYCSGCGVNIVNVHEGNDTCGDCVTGL